MWVWAGGTCSGLMARQSDALLVMLGHDASLAAGGEQPERTNMNTPTLQNSFQDNCMTQRTVVPQNNDYGILTSKNRLEGAEFFLL